MLYTPAEDSYLLACVIKNFARGKSVLDIGSGSGILAQTAIKAGAKSVLAVDSAPEAVCHIKNLGLSVKQSALFSNISKNSKFNLIICNPPYLPLDKRESRESRQNTTGGKKGDEIILRFLKQAQNHLTKRGIILLLLSSLTPQKRILALLGKLRYKHEVIASKKFFFEELFVWKVTNMSSSTISFQ